MKLTKLELKNYRNCKSILLDFDSDKTLIIGKNAQGKTNILESVYYLSSLKNLRAINNSELINFDEQDFQIHGTVLKSDTEIEMDYYYDREKKRETKLNKVKTTPKNFKSVLKTVLFASSDLSLVRGTPQDRRNWLDRAVSQIYPAYDERLAKYDKIRIQKNNLLKEDYIDKNLLNVFNEQLAISGSNIIFLRNKYLKEIEKIAKEKHKDISQSENFSLNYVHPFYETEPELPEDINITAKNFANQLEISKDEEIRRKQSCVGPHRDDIIFYINGTDSSKYASQGQQRTIVLALKLAEITMIKDKTGFSPVLLLDDVLAELDDLRQNYLLKSINSNTQTIITSVDTLLFDEDFLKDVAIYNIEQGQIKAGN